MMITSSFKDGFVIGTIAIGICGIFGGLSINNHGLFMFFTGVTGTSFVILFLDMLS